ncbi:hypothetical protein [Candidatus Bodocaedibacter vickermanii]|uniref:Uncharacterized protein n=1 Tax=Candidatus Bodocaedibacter vickermanii TaxID=2741701 RepID=A0A7L9RS93_9PROT|nr:hypothetical protein CPBP_00174 [Candidatus Paracaedibacteraceae bacterium 'Lake Konstanz']
MLVHIDPTSAAALNTEWRLDYTTGESVLVDSTNKILERNLPESVSDLRISDEHSDFVLGDVHYTRKSGTPLILIFQSELYIDTLSHQDDETLELKVFIYRYCFFANKSYHLPSEIKSITPYTLLPENTTYSDIEIDEPSLSVMFTYKAHHKRPLDGSDCVCSRRLTAATHRTLLGYKYADEQLECYPIYHLTAFHEGYEVLNKEFTSTQPVPYRRCDVSRGRLDQSSIEHIAPDRISIITAEEWLRPDTSVPIQLSRRIELPVTTEANYEHDDVNLRSNKLSRSFVRYNSDTIILSETSEVIAYFEMFAIHDLTKPLRYKRPGGAIYTRDPISFSDDEEDGDIGFELL